MKSWFVFFWSDAEIERDHLLTKMVCTVERFHPGSVIESNLPAIGAPAQAFKDPAIGYATDTDSVESYQSVPSLSQMLRNLPERTHALPSHPNFDPQKSTFAVADSMPQPPPPPPPESERHAKPVYYVNS